MEPVVVALRPLQKSFGWSRGLLVFLGVIVASLSGNPSTPFFLSPSPALFGAVIGAIPWLITYSRRWAVQQVDDRGLVLRSGKLFPWSDLRGIERVTLTQLGTVVREDYVLGFRGGGVRIRSTEYEDVRQQWAYLDEVAKRRAP